MRNYVAEIFKNNEPFNDKVAIIDNDGERSTSWKELYEKSCAIASHATELGLKGLVPVCMPRCKETVEVLLGLGLAGLGVTPISDHMPKSRLAIIEEETGNTAWTMEKYEQVMQQHEQAKQHDDAATQLSNQEKAEGTLNFEPVDFEIDAPAFVIYTSGSTGTPKGVVLSNATVEKSYKRMGSNEFLDLKPGDIVLQNAPFSFVAIMIDVYAPLYYGCTTHLIPDYKRTDINLMTEYINKHEITSLWITPKPLAKLGKTPSLKVVCVGGERVMNQGPRGYKLLNVWGMSETAALALGYKITEPMSKTPIGKSLGDFKCYIVDENGKLADEGELCLSGAIASGYYKREDLNKEYFEANPFSSEEGYETLMHTGDIVKRLEDGNLLYLNRKDYMIKINGQRVEPGEAETVIAKIDGVKAVAVKGFTEEDGHSYLCAYYVSEDGLELETIREKLEEALPEYMIPTFYVKLEAMPLNANGKLDRKSLAAPQISQYHNVYVAPNNEIEAALCHAFERALKVEKVGIHDDFLYLGGDSIRAMTVVGLAKIDGLDTSSILKGRTPERIGELLSEKEKDAFAQSQIDIDKTPLTDSQMGIYLECMLAPESVKYNIPYSLSFERKTGMEAGTIKEIVDSVIELHPALYSRIVAEGEEVYMLRSAMPSEGICQISESENWDEFLRPFELGSEPLCRVNVIVSDAKVKLMIDTHHIVSDGRSTAILADQICKAIAGESIPEEKVDAFSVYECLSRAGGKDIAHFDALLGGVELDSNLIPDRKSDESNPMAERVVLTIDDIDFEKLCKSGITISTFFMGVFGYTLAKMTGQSESLFAVAENGRRSALLDTTVLMMVRTLPVYMKISEKMSSFKQLLDLQEQFYASMENDNVSFERLSKEYGVNSDVMFVYQSDTLSGGESEIGNVELEFVPSGRAISNFNAAVFKRGNKHEVILEYRSDLYDRENIERFANIFKNAAACMADNETLDSIKLISDKDIDFLDVINKTESGFKHDETMVDAFRKRATEHPDKLAVVFKDRKYTYAEVDEISDRIAAYINSLGIGRGQVVSVLIPRSEYLFIASMGVMKSGAIYQPLDPSYPSERLTFMVEDAASALVIADRKLLSMITGYKGKVLAIDDIPALRKREVSIEPPCNEDICLLLYTSGTTGKPKGCRIAHKNLRAIVNTHTIVTKMDENSVQGAYASYGFDAHMTDLYPAISLGGTLVIVPDKIRLDLEAVKDYLENNKVSHVILTTQLCVQFIKQYRRLEYLKCIMAGGEKLVSLDPPENYKLFNGYGPTECSVYSTAFEVDALYDDIPIGKPVSDNKVYVVDAEGRRLPPGVPGELIIAGPQVSAGYLNRPEKTAEVFVKNTFEDNVPEQYERAYRTGDIVRFISDGNLVFVGRRDMQVKIRGFRIELSEVEKVILDYPGIKSATLLARDAAAGGKCLHAYITSDEKIDIEALNEYIRSVKPPYMVPAATMQLDSLPLTVNGKVDKRKLPEMKVQFDDVVKPQNELQQKIFDKVVEVMGFEDFGIENDLFDAGLSSIGSIRLCSLLADEFGIHVQMRNLKKYPTVSMLEEFVTKSREEDAVSEHQHEQFTEDYPISKTMEGIFVECTGKPDSTFYNVPYLIKLGDSVDEAKLSDALVAAVEAHPYMKAELFTDSEGRIRQHRRVDDAFTKDMIGKLAANNIDDIKGNLVKPFKITETRLFNISIIHAQGVYLYLDFHHIISDGTSINLFLNDVEKAYEGHALETEKYSGFDISSSENRERTSENLEEAKEYYSNLLEGLDRDFLPLPDKYAQQEPSTGKLRKKLCKAELDRIKKYCADNRVSLNGFFTSAFGFTLSKYAGTDYSVFNTIYNGRNDSRTSNTFAMLVKTLPAVCHIDKDACLEFVSEMSTQIVDNMANDLYSYAEIANDLGINNDVMFVFQGEGFRRETFCGESIEEIDVVLSESKAPMAFELILENGEIICELEYDPLRFTNKLMETFVSAFDMACAGLSSKEKLSEISILAEEIEADMEAFNETEFEYDRTETITGLFLEKARKYPDKLCVSYCDKHITYAEAEKLTGKLARYLNERGIGANDIVPILIKRDENMVITAHGVVRAGAAYLGLDPTYPSDRLEFMIEDSGAKCLIADRTLMDLIPGYKGPVIYTDEINNLPDMDAEHAVEPTPENNAIVIYSSGTTGIPKGSLLQHKAIVCFYHNYTKDSGIDATSNVASYASFGFDGGAQDVFCIPMVGASLFVIPDDMRLDIKALENFYVCNSITSGFMTTQVGTMFISATKCRSLKHFLVGGEKFIPVMAPSWVNFANGYGPSETMCYVNRYQVRDTGSLQPIGKTSGNTKEYIIDKFGNRLPFGACGELCISGGQMGRGYLNRPEKTGKAFVNNPFCDQEGYKRMYRTGDVVRMLTDGNYDFVGRRDGQVKIRGFRIELSEIEMKIREFEGVQKVVVTAFDNPSGRKELVSYVVAEGELDIDALRAYIAEDKPDYMVPAVIMQIDEVPLTSNGKVDYKKLPKPDFRSRRKGAEPSDEREEKICSIFAEVLGLDKVYADDNFFSIGGSSISAIQVVVKCEQAGMSVVYKNLFANPTAQKLNSFICGEKSKDVISSDLEKEDEYNYDALKYNVVENLTKIKNNGVGKVLLTGATGFLGCHVFRELIDSTGENVICLVRGKGTLSAEKRFEMMMVYYFEDWYQDTIKERVRLVDADIEEEGLLEKLKDEQFDTIINCAANVKHFAAGDELMKANFTGVEQLIDLAENKDARLIQISSLSVCGESVNGSVPEGYKFKETDLNIGQSLENKYIYTKYLAEQAVIDATSRKRIRGKVIRLGNLMARYDDSEFQINAGTNGFMRMYRGFNALGCFPIGMMDAEVEMSPIDATSKAIVLLSGTPDEFTVFHAKNCNSIHYGYFMNAIRMKVRPVEIVEDDEFERRLEKALENEHNVEKLAGLLAYKNGAQASLADTVKFYDNEDDTKEVRVKIGSDTNFTTKALYRLGFSWPLVSEEYLEKMVDNLIGKNFFSEE